MTRQMDLCDTLCFVSTVKNTSYNLDTWAHSAWGWVGGGGGGEGGGKKQKNKNNDSNKQTQKQVHYFNKAYSYI